MAETPRLDLPYLSASQAQKEIMHNVSLDRLDLLVQCTVLDRNLNTPPASPTLGDAYIVGPTPTGVWTGHANALALYINLQWQFIAPLAGFQCWVLDEAVQVGWSGSAWTITGSGGAGATTLLGLTDTPDTYAGQAGKTLLVNPGETGMVFGTVAGSAPVDATYIVSSANATLSAERVVTDNTQIAWDVSTAGQLKAALAAHGVALDRLPQLPEGSVLGRGGTLDPVDDVQVLTVGPGLEVAGTTLQVVGGGVSNFLALADTPDSYAGQAGKAVVVKAGADGLEFGTVGSATVTEAEIVLADVTADNATTALHGFLPKLSGTATEYLNGTGLWSTPAGGGGGTPVAMRGCRLTHSTARTGVSYTGGTTLAWDTEQYDTDGLHSTVTNTERITIPAGVTRVQLTYGIALANVAANNSVAASIRMNGSTLYADSVFGVWTYTNPGVTVTTGVLPVVAGDYFEARLYCSDASIDVPVGSSTFFACEIIEPLAVGGGSSDFLGLSDTPNSYSGQAGKAVVVNAGATATEFGPVLGTLATQNANAVAITGGSATLGGLTVTTGTAMLESVSVTGTAGVGGNLLVTGTSQLINAVGMGTAPVAGQQLTTGPSFPVVLGHNLQVGGVTSFGTVPAATIRALLYYTRASQIGLVIHPTDVDTGGNPAVLFSNVAHGTVGSITTTATATAYNTSSDRRLKDAIETMPGALEAVLALRPVQFLWKADGSVGHGFVADEVEQVAPEAVTGDADAVDADGHLVPQGLDMSKLVPYLVGAVQELAAQVDALTARLEALEGVA